MTVIGLCGGSGSGKGTVADLFAIYGIPSIDTDALYHKMTSEKTPCLDALEKVFGSRILNQDGSLNRKALADIVFSGENSADKRATLNKISHAFVLDETKRIIAELEKNGVKLVLVDAPLLFESGFNEFCDIVIAVVADMEIRIKRIMLRDSIPKNKAILRIKSQLPDEYLIKNSTYHLVNNGTFDDLASAVSSLVDKIFNFKENDNV